MFENDEVEVLRPHIPYFNVKLLDMFDAEKNVKTDVANRAHMTFTVKVDEPLQENDMLVKSNKVLSL